MKYSISNILLILSISFSCISCRLDTPVDTPPVDITNIMDTIKSDSTENDLPGDADSSEDTIVRIRFKELDILLSGTMIYDEHDTLKYIQTDTVSLMVELGWDVEGIQISYQTQNITDVKISQRYETSISVNDEGPHCDMIDWKHYTSPWHQLKPDENEKYITDEYDPDDYSKFPDVSMAEFKQAVRAHCDEYWVGLIANNKSVNDPPSHASISRVFFHITGKDKITGGQISKLLIFIIPLGC